MNDSTFTLKSGTNKGHRRMWIEGQRLAALGLRKGRPLHRVMHADGSLTLTTAETTGRRHTVAGTGDRPIIDLTGKWVSEFIGTRSHFRVEPVTYSDAGRDMVDLVITPCNG